MMGVERFGWDLDKDEIVFVYVPEDDEEPAQEPSPQRPRGRKAARPAPVGPLELAFQASTALQPLELVRARRSTRLPMVLSRGGLGRRAAAAPAVSDAGKRRGGASGGGEE